MEKTMNEPKLRLGVSACLLGEAVRYDGQHKRDRWLTDILAPYVEFVPVCPEVECGLPVPREAMRLVGDPDAPRLMTQKTGKDLTDQMQGWIATRLRTLEKENLSGFIFKSRSPSSGMERVKVYNPKGGLNGRGSGLFAKAFMERFPSLPVEDEGRLNDALLRENFIERIFTLHRFRQAMQPRPSVGRLVKFHEQNKFLIMCHHQAKMRELGRLTAGTRKDNLAGQIQIYERELLAALKPVAKAKRHANVQQHILGFFKHELTHDEKQEMLETIERFREGLVPLIVPITLMNHYVRKYNIEYLQGQYYLDPLPVELQLRNHA